MQRRKFVKSFVATAAMAAVSGCSTQRELRPVVSGHRSTADHENADKRLYIDGLTFVPEEHSDVAASQLSSFIADISAVEPVENPDGTVNYKRTYKACMDSLKDKTTVMSAHPDVYRIATKGSEIERANEQGRCAVFLQIQGADCVEGGLEQVDEFHQLGLRALQLTHHYNNVYAGGGLSAERRGLSTAGHALIEKLESKQMLIDLSHCSDLTADDTLKKAKGPIVLSHGSARAIVNNARCTPDEILRRIADSGGVFGVFMMSWWLTDDKVPSPEHYIRQLKHIRNIAGIDVVAIANDYPLRGQTKALASGNNNAIAIQGYKDWWGGIGESGILGFDKEVHHIVIPELNHIKRMRSIERELVKANFTSDEIDKIMGRNWQRVLIDVLG